MLNLPAVNVESIDYALDRLVTFNQINHKREDKQDRLDGVKYYCESVGLDPDAVVYLYDGMEQKFGPESASQMFIGVLIGLAIMEYQVDTCED